MRNCKVNFFIEFILIWSKLSRIGFNDNNFFTYNNNQFVLKLIPNDRINIQSVSYHQFAREPNLIKKCMRTKLFSLDQKVYEFLWGLCSYLPLDGHVFVLKPLPEASEA